MHVSMRCRLRAQSPRAIFCSAWIALLAITIGIGCGGSSTRRPSDLIFIVNNTKTPIQSIRYERCDTPGSGQVPIPADRPFKPGEELRVKIIEGCVNLIAVDIEGDVVGRQRELRMKPGMVWRIY